MMRIQLDIQYPSLDIRTAQPYVTLKRQDGTITISSRGPELSIDNKASWEDLGYGDYRYIMKQGAERGRAAVLDAIAQWSADGDRYARHMDAATYAQMAAERNAEGEVELNVRCAPRPRPQIAVDYDLTIRGYPGSVEVTAHMAAPSSQLQPGSVTITALRRGEHFDRKG